MSSIDELVMNQGLDPLVSFNYMLRVEGAFDLPCKSIRSFSRENEFEYIQEGGLNDYVHSRRKPISKPFTFSVERYVGTDIYDPLQLGTELILPVILLVSRYTNRFDITKRAYVFTGCTVTGKEYGELNAEQSGLLTETTTITYRELVVVDMPNDQNLDTWDFDGSLKGKGTRRAKTVESTESEKRQWKFDTGETRNPAGIGTRSAVTENAGKPQQRKWPTVSSAKK